MLIVSMFMCIGRCIFLWLHMHIRGVHLRSFSIPAISLNLDRFIFLLCVPAFFLLSCLYVDMSGRFQRSCIHMYLSIYWWLLSDWILIWRECHVLQEMLLRICCAMLLCMRSRLLSGDFMANLKLLQHYPEINIEYLLQVAQGLSPDISAFRLSP